MITELASAKTSEIIKLPTGAELNVTRQGNGDELVVFIHAVGGDLNSWLPQLTDPRFNTYTLVSLDLRGHGKSKYPGEQNPENIYKQVTIEHFAKDLICLIKDLGYKRAHLVGLSMGGTVALEVFKQESAVVQSLTMANSWAYHQQAKDKIAFMQDRLKSMTMRQSIEGLVENLFAPGTDKKILAQSIETESNKNKDVFLSSWVSMFSHDWRDTVKEIDVPLLLIGGTNDQITPTDPLLKDIHKLVYTSQLVNIEGAGHFSNLDHTDEFNSALISHLRRGRLPGSQKLAIGKTTETIKANTVAQGLMGLLNKRGISYFFSNSGTDFTPIIDALARYSEDSDFKLKPIAIPHENTAIAMAHGYYLLSGKPQAVMAHVNVGTANMALGVINASRSHIPMLVLAGKSPWYEEEVDGCRTNFVQWGQDTFDQAASVREFVKWDYELKGKHNLENVVDRCLAISQSDPQGPVYLTLPKEPLCEQIDNLTVAGEPRQKPHSDTEPSQENIEQAAQLIAQAKNPLIVTAELGRYQGGVEALVKLAEQNAIGVIEHGKHNFFNFPTNHPMHLGFSPSPFVEQADLIIVIESHVPWIPALSKMSQSLERSVPLIQIGIDPLCQGIPMRSFASDITLAGNPAKTLKRLAQSLHLNKNNPRYKEIEGNHNRVFESFTKDAAADSKEEKITKRFLSYSLGQVVDDNTVIFNEYNLEPTLIPRHLTDSWFENSIASGLGWSLGAALGAKLAAPEQTIIVTLGDGSYLFNTPLSAHYVAAAYDLPIVIVVFNDSAWSTIKKSYLGTTPDGWAKKKNNFPLCNFNINVDFEKIAESVGGIGLKVEKPADLLSTLKKAIDLTRTGNKHVLVNVVCQRDA